MYAQLILETSPEKQLDKRTRVSGLLVISPFLNGSKNFEFTFSWHFGKKQQVTVSMDGVKLLQPKRNKVPKWLITQ